jgi:phospholipase D1/2
MELALKVASKIRDHQPFAVYVVIPMWPEGAPDSGPMQEILFFQVLIIALFSFLGKTMVVILRPITCVG